MNLMRFTEKRDIYKQRIKGYNRHNNSIKKEKAFAVAKPQMLSLVFFVYRIIISDIIFLCNYGKRRKALV
jgi:hypothetical protein